MSPEKLRVVRKQMLDIVMSYCRDKSLFTCGSIQQYTKMFDLLKDGAPAHDVALIIWVCSESDNIKSLQEIEDYLILTENKIAKNIL